MITATRYKTPTANRGYASLIYFNYMDGPSTQFFQDTLKLAKFMDGYDCKVLLKDQTTPSWLDLSEKDEKTADIMLPATKTNFFKQLIALANDGLAIDLFIFSHGWKSGFGGVANPKGDPKLEEKRITNADITSRLAPAETGLSCMPIRAQWGTDCEASTRNALWTSVGAVAASGSRAVNFYPNGAGNFISDWNKGNVSFERAVRDADTDLVRTAVQTYISIVDAPAKKKADKWCGCPLLKTVLGDDPCAKEYFKKCWELGDDWQQGKSGKEMMNYSSFKLIEGNKDITKNSRPKWG